MDTMPRHFVKWWPPPRNCAVVIDTERRDQDGQGLEVASYDCIDLGDREAIERAKAEARRRNETHGYK